MTRNPCPRHVPKPERAGPFTLSVVEVMVGELIGKGYDDDSIAAHIGCTRGTARQYRVELEAARRRNVARSARG